MTTLRIDGRYNGPVGMGNGGYVCGMLANHLTAGPGQSIRVSLRAPCPLDRDLQVLVEDSSAKLLDGEALIAGAALVEGPVSDRPVAIPDQEQAASGATRFIVHDDEMYLQCFVCGTARGDDALHIHAGAVEGLDHTVATPWTADADYKGEDGFVRPEIIWAALDCPGFFACSGTERTLLASIQVQILDQLKPGEPCRVVGWDKAEGARVGRKRPAGTALVGSDDRLIAVSDQLWIVLRDAA